MNNTFHYVEVVTISNGKSWSAETMARQITSKYIVKNFHADKIIVWLDCEQRTCTPHYLEFIVRKELSSVGVSGNDLFVCIPNRMTENIIPADEDLIQQEFDDPNYRYQYEGQNGKSILRSLFSSKSIVYKETIHGVRLLKQLRLAEVSPFCTSAITFCAALNLQCWWLRAR